MDLFSPKPKECERRGFFSLDIQSQYLKLILFDREHGWNNESNEYNIEKVVKLKKVVKVSAGTIFSAVTGTGGETTCAPALLSGH